MDGPRSLEDPRESIYVAVAQSAGDYTRGNHCARTGKRAFQGKTHLSTASSILEKDPDPLSTILPLAPKALEHTVQTCLAKDPEERFQSAQDLKIKLLRL